MSVHEGVREILAAPEWDSIHVADHKAFFVIAGRFNGKAHAGTREDWQSLAVDLDRIAREQYAALLREAEAERSAAEDALEAPEAIPVEASILQNTVAAIEPAPLLPPADTLLSDYGPVGPDADRDAEIAELRARIDDLQDANDALKDALANAEDELRDRPEPEDAIPADLAQLVTNDEGLAAAVDRMTPGLDELLQMAELLSEPSLEQALSTIPPDRVNEWTERLNSEKGELRTKRGTVDENLERENLINRVSGTFTRVGAKR